MPSPWFLVRIMGLLTLSYGAFTAARPDTLLQAAHLIPERGSDEATSPSLSEDDELVAPARMLGVRDAVIGAAMLLGPGPQWLRPALIARLLSDGSDVGIFGVLCPPERRPVVMSVAASWGALCATAWALGEAGQRRKDPCLAGTPRSETSA